MGAPLSLVPSGNRNCVERHESWTQFEVSQHNLMEIGILFNVLVNWWLICVKSYISVRSAYTLV